MLQIYKNTASQRQTDTQTDRQTHRQTDRHADRQADRQTEKERKKASTHCLCFTDSVRNNRTSKNSQDGIYGGPSSPVTRCFTFLSSRTNLSLRPCSSFFWNFSCKSERFLFPGTRNRPLPFSWNSEQPASQ